MNLAADLTASAPSTLPAPPDASDLAAPAYAAAIPPAPRPAVFAPPPFHTMPARALPAALTVPPELAYVVLEFRSRNPRNDNLYALELTVYSDEPRSEEHLLGEVAFGCEVGWTEFRAGGPVGVLAWQTKPRLGTSHDYLKLCAIAWTRRHHAALEALRRVPNHSPKFWPAIWALNARELMNRGECACGGESCLTGVRRV